MLSEPKASSPIRKRTGSPMALQVNSMGRAGIQVKMMCTVVEQDRQSVVVGLLAHLHEF